MSPIFSLSRSQIALVSSSHTRLKFSNWLGQAAKMIMKFMPSQVSHSLSFLFFLFALHTFPVLSLTLSSLWLLVYTQNERWKYFSFFFALPVQWIAFCCVTTTPWENSARERILVFRFICFVEMHAKIKMRNMLSPKKMYKIIANKTCPL